MKSIANRLHTLAAACLLLSACAGSQTFKEGNALLDAGQIDQGLAKLEQAAHEDPHNAEYRIVLLNRKLKLVNAMNSRADTLRLKGQSADATALYEQALAIDPANLIARQGLAALMAIWRSRRVAGVFNWCPLRLRIVFDSTADR